ncbi:hypothetical protein C8R44DRAFT_731583 [Mycena epipterygia]|nr:hypothetical protein C8R44DRAFT_731583 [Mycena epipterygia]
MSGCNQKYILRRGTSLRKYSHSMFISKQDIASSRHKFPNSPCNRCMAKTRTYQVRGTAKTRFQGWHVVITTMSGSHLYGLNIATDLHLFLGGMLRIIDLVNVLRVARGTTYMPYGCPSPRLSTPNTPRAANDCQKQWMLVVIAGTVGKCRRQLTPKREVGEQEAPKRSNLQFILFDEYICIQLQQAKNSGKEIGIHGDGTRKKGVGLNTSIQTQ